MSILASTGGLSQTHNPLLPKELSDLPPGELLINEFFASLQGESTFAGWPCFFIRVAGCHLRCSYCDTRYAFFEGRRETIEHCLGKAVESGLKLVEVTGGEPLLQKAVHPLLSALCDEGFKVLLETSGACDLRQVDPRVHKIVDVKCPSSAMAPRNLSDLPSQLKIGDEVKFVMADRRDFDWAEAWLSGEGRSLHPDMPVHFSPVHGQLQPDRLARWIIEKRLPVRLNLQLHKILWPEADRGV